MKALPNRLPKNKVSSSLLTLVFLFVFTGLSWSETPSQEISNQINEQKRERAKYSARISAETVKKRERLTALAQKQKSRKLKQDEILKEHLMAIKDIETRLKDFDGDIDSCIRKIMQTKLKPSREQDGKRSTVDPDSAADTSGLNLGKNPKPYTNNTTRIMTSGDYKAALRELSPTLKIEFIKTLKIRYGEALQKHQKKYNSGAKELSKTEEFSELINEENNIQDQITESEENIKRNERQITRSNLRIAGLNERYKKAHIIENPPNTDGGIDNKISEDTAQLTPKEDEIEEDPSDEDGDDIASSENPKTEETKQTPENVVDIPIIKVTASAKIEEDYSSGGYKNIVSSTLVLSFNNVGNQVPGYGKVYAKWTAVSSLNGSKSENVFKGTYSGGPDGVINLSSKGKTYKMKVYGGTTIKTPFPGGLSALSISNPSAFKYWKK